ncbi:MAG: hypothetical protein FWE27_09895 [Defluviitaleaceae bacterium]|nr:hypothetical protein [Defluviitaleaceae bacterium]
MNDFLSLLKGVSGNGNQYKAKCPAHDDKIPSLSVSVSDSRILLHCHAGCSTEKILGVLGLEVNALYVEGTSAPSRANGQNNIVAVYDYKDLDCNIVHSTIRYENKIFRQRRPDANNPMRFIWKDVFKGITPILYNLTAVTNAIKENQPVLVVEGEKDCETLSKYGFVATTNAMGAGKWRDHYSDLLKDGTIYIVADNDETGNNHAKNVAKSLAGKAEAIFFVDLLSVMPELPTGGDISDYIAAVPHDERTAAVSALLENAAQYAPEKEASQEKNGSSASGEKKNQAEQLLNFVELTGATFFHSDIKELYAAIPVKNHTEVLPIMGRDFEIWLNSQFYKGCGKPISKDAIKQVLGVLSAKALFDNPTPVKLSVRITEHDGAFWYDLTNIDWQSVKITANGWKVIDNPPILFSRYRHQISQSMPKKDGNIRKILDYINIKESKTLFLCWLVSCFVPGIPHVILIIHGEKGAAKSTASVMTKFLVDPSALDTLTLQNDQRTLAVNLQNHWFLPFDNVSFVNEDTSDTLCRAATGGAIQQRKLHTNAEDTIFTFRRCIAINGIHNVATRSDLLDRSILIELMRIKDNNRKELSRIMANFEADRADILGGIFDTVARAIAIYPTVKLENFPRMADFARWGYSIGEALGAGLGEIFLAEYERNRLIQNEEAIANDPVALLINEFMRNRDEWHGKYSEFYKQLVFISEDYGINPKAKPFPSNSSALSRKITNVKSNLEAVGINIIRDKRTSDGQTLSIKRSKIPTFPTLPTQTADNAACGNVGNSVGNASLHLPTQMSTPDKPLNLADYVGNVDNVGKNAPSSEDWNNLCEIVPDAKVPEEFL